MKVSNPPPCERPAKWAYSPRNRGVVSAPMYVCRYHAITLPKAYLKPIEKVMV
jgi:hypothetical protein